MERPEVDYAKAPEDKQVVCQYVINQILPVLTKKKYLDIRYTDEEFQSMAPALKAEVEEMKRETADLFKLSRGLLRRVGELA